MLIFIPNYYFGLNRSINYGSVFYVESDLVTPLIILLAVVYFTIIHRYPLLITHKPIVDLPEQSIFVAFV